MLLRMILILISIFLSKSGGEAKDELGAFELIDPFGDNGLAKSVFSFRDEADGAGGSAQAGGFIAIFGKGFFAVSGNFKAILADKNQGGYALAAIDANGRGEFGRGGVSINESQVEKAGGCGFDNLLKDGALAGTVAAPGAREAEHAHAASEKGQAIFLLGCQRNGIGISLPSSLVLGRAITGQKFVVCQTFGEVSGPVNH